MDLAWEADTDPLPGLAVFLPGFEIPDLESRLDEDERDRQVGPKRIPAEVQHVELVPSELVAQSAKRPSCVRSLRQHPASIGFDANGTSFEDSPLACSRIWSEDDLLPSRRDVG
jgi:hypothetical protein